MKKNHICRISLACHHPRLSLLAGAGFLLLSMGLTSCQKIFLGADPGNTPRDNFDNLWNTIDQKYSFFSYKRINWDSVYNIYSPKVNNQMNDVQLFNVMFEMLGQLRDSHVNLVSSFNVSRYEQVFMKGLINYDQSLLYTYYLKTDYYITGPIKHQVVGNGKVGYMRYDSFMDEIAAGNIDFVVSRFSNLKGMIIDVRSNGGGTVDNVFTICSRFTDKVRPVYTSYQKAGPGHEDFSGGEQVYASPGGTYYPNKVCILTNRGCYSATSFFVLAMRNFPNVTVVGDSTGGGLGAPTGAELPNGWGYRFSSSKTLSPEGENFEDGVPPDVYVNMKDSDAKKGLDTIIEKAIAIILAD